MPFEIVRNDITKMEVDAIVNAANESLLGGGGVDGAIHRAAGPELLEECRALRGCKTGEAKITGGYRLPARYVIHTVGPVWHGGWFGEKRLLESCYRSSLELAKKQGCQRVAFPLISAGAYGYPKDKAIRVAMDAIADFLMENDMTVYLVVFDKSAFQISAKLFRDIQSYIDDHYTDCYGDGMEERRRRMRRIREREAREDFCYEMAVPREAPMQTPMVFPQAAEPVSLKEMLAEIDESFSEMLLRKIDEKGMKDAQCYKKANIDRKLFSKIRSDKFYKPSKPTVLAFAIALELPLEETKEMLQKAGFALSHSNKFDIIVEYFIQKGNFDIYQINEALFAFDQSLLGG